MPAQGLTSVIDLTATSDNVPHYLSAQTLTLINRFSSVLSLLPGNFHPFKCNFEKCLCAFKCPMNWQSFPSCRCQLLYVFWHWSTHIRLSLYCFPFLLLLLMAMDHSLIKAVTICGSERAAAAPSATEKLYRAFMSFHRLRHWTIVGATVHCHSLCVHICGGVSFSVAIQRIKGSEAEHSWWTWEQAGSLTCSFM